MISDNIEQIEKLIHMVSNSEIGELSVKEGELEIVIRKKPKCCHHKKEMSQAMQQRPVMSPIPQMPPMPTIRMPYMPSDMSVAMNGYGMPYQPYGIGWPQPPVSQNSSMQNAEMQRTVPVNNVPTENTADTKPVMKGNQVTSPLVGTFYASSSPDTEPFVKKGDRVKKGQVLGIIEAMKLMNEIECEYDGVVADILVKNEEKVEYGQPLFIIQ